MRSEKQWRPYGTELAKGLYKGGEGEGEISRERGVCFARRTWHSNAKMSGKEGTGIYDGVGGF